MSDEPGDGAFDHGSVVSVVVDVDPVAASVDVAVVSKRLGHSSPVVTWQTHQHVRQGMQSVAAERVAGAIFGV